MSGVTLVFLAVVTARFLVPLSIPRYPLPGIVASLVLDGVDQTIFQAFGYDPPGYQSYDKAMDVYYLAIAYLTTLRNWQSIPAYRVGQALYFYRLVGVVAFELSQIRALLLIFANTFEYFFIAYEAIRSRWSPVAFALRWWIGVAAAIWIVVKLPQEYWIHVAQLDVTDELAARPWALPLLVVVAVGLALLVWLVVWPRLPQPDWSWRIEADPLHEDIDTGAEQAAWRAKYGRVRSWATVEKVVLLGLISVIFAEILPGVRVTTVQLFVGVAVVVVVNAAITLAAARREMTVESTALAFAARVAVNVVLVILAEWILGRGSGDIDAGATLFFLMLISLLTTLHDRWSPVRDHRLAMP
ncbi:MAG: hypothetical protein ACXWDM_08160 [Nocardioides sp.]